MNDDEAAPSPSHGEDSAWIASLGLTADGEELIRHSLEVADAVMKLDERDARRAAAETVDAGGAPGERRHAGRLVREGPSVPIAQRREAHIQPAPVRAVSRQAEESEARPQGEPSPDRRGSERTPHPPLPGPAT